MDGRLACLRKKDGKGLGGGGGETCWQTSLAVQQTRGHKVKGKRGQIGSGRHGMHNGGMHSGRDMAHKGLHTGWMVSDNMGTNGKDLIGKCRSTGVGAAEGRGWAAERWNG